MYHLDIAHLDFFFLNSFTFFVSYIEYSFFALWKVMCNSHYAKDLGSFPFFSRHIMNRTLREHKSVLSCSLNTFWLVWTEINSPSS